jgi:hypothetical protein
MRGRLMRAGITAQKKFRLRLLEYTVKKQTKKQSKRKANKNYYMDILPLLLSNFGLKNRDFLYKTSATSFLNFD